MNTPRRTLLKGGLLTALSMPFLKLSSQVNNSTKKMENEKLDPAMVQEFVGNCHGNFQRVKELYEKEPRLIFASHDWGKGDFENGIEAAGHMGNREIAQFLLDKGARINFFTLCMLGEYDLVNAMIKAHPYLATAKGPHGFTPLHHAKQGGAASEKVLKLLEGMGAKDLQVTL